MELGNQRFYRKTASTMGSDRVSHSFRQDFRDLRGRNSVTGWLKVPARSCHLHPAGAGEGGRPSDWGQQLPMCHLCHRGQRGQRQSLRKPALGDGTTSCPAQSAVKPLLSLCKALGQAQKPHNTSGITSADLFRVLLSWPMRAEKETGLLR